MNESNLNDELVILGGGAAAEADEDAVGALRVRHHGRPQERPLRVGSPAAAVQHRIGGHGKVCRSMGETVLIVGLD